MSKTGFSQATRHYQTTKPRTPERGPRIRGMTFSGPARYSALGFVLVGSMLTPGLIVEATVTFLM
jgi:hypothetical protein